MTPDQLSAIRERLDAATPGPWEAGTAACCPDMGWVDGPKGAVCPQFTATKVTHSLDANDAELIANAPTDLRALLDEVERLTKREDELVKAGLDLMVANKDLTIKRDTPFRRGAEAMRMAVLAEFKRWFLAKEPMISFVRNLQGLPIPEDR